VGGRREKVQYKWSDSLTNNLKAITEIRKWGARGVW